MVEPSPDRQPPPHESVSRPAPSESDAVRDTGFFVRVLESTLAKSGVGEDLEEAEFEALRKAVRSHRGEPFVLEPVAVAMVQAILGSQFQGQSERSSLWEGMCARIARTLFEDPAARARLQTLWAHLSET